MCVFITDVPITKLFAWRNRLSAQRLGCVYEVPLRGFSRVTPVLWFKELNIRFREGQRNDVNTGEMM